ncbi:hypothetical protein ASC94_16710 [Massilia sp. Root418]|nr:hypothetical protein ASC94_16710 [Massilia sp. Root418]
MAQSLEPDVARATRRCRIDGFRVQGRRSWAEILIQRQGKGALKGKAGGAVQDPGAMLLVTVLLVTVLLV